MEDCNNITFRRGKLDDLKKLLTLDETIFGNKVSKDYYAQNINTNTCYVAEYNNEIIGCILFYDNYYLYDYDLTVGYIKSLFSVKYKCKIGQQLINLAIKDIKNNLPICLHVDVNNFRAINLYFKMGFKIYEIVQKYYGDDNGFLMKLDKR